MESEAQFDFNAPQYLNSLESAAALDNDEAELFFDADSATDDADIYRTPRKLPDIKEEEVESEGKVVDNTILDEVGILVRATPGKKHSMITRLDIRTNTPIRQLRSREVAMVPPNNPGARKRKAAAAAASPCMSTTSSLDVTTSGRSVQKAKKIMTLAEEIYHFHKDTPPRFRTKWKMDGPPQCKFRRMSPTKPQTPQLATRFRARHIHNAQEDNVDRSLAAPLHHETKKTPQETKHTKNIKKEEPDNDEPFIFKAKPVPVSTYVKDGNNAMNSTRLAKSSVLPNGKRIKIESESLGGTIYDRSTQMMRRKEEKIEKMKHEQQSNRWNFHANPLPQSIYHLNTTSVSSTKSRHSTRCEASAQAKSLFKARFPSVLYKAPFVPKKVSEGREALKEIKESDLSTRASRRKEFERKLQDRCEGIKKTKQEV